MVTKKAMNSMTRSVVTLANRFKLCLLRETKSFSLSAMTTFFYPSKSVCFLSVCYFLLCGEGLWVRFRVIRVKTCAALFFVSLAHCTLSV